MNTIGAPTALRPWATIVVGAAAAMTALDAVLLQLKRAFFTGGFQAVDYLRTPAQAFSFLVVSFAGDVAVIGVAAGAAFLLARALRMAWPAAALLAALAPLFGLLLADVISYRLVSYLGDAFDLSLMFDLTGRNAAEIWAVSSKQLALPGAAVAGIALVTVVGIRGVNRRAVKRGSAPVRFRSRPFLLTVLVIFLGGVVATTAARVLSPELDNGLKRKPSTRLLGTLVDLASDIDRDGFGVLRMPADPAPTDPRIYPYAVDQPGNGIDEDGLAGDLPLATLYSEPSPPAARWTQRPDVVLIVLESFRADVVGTVVNGKPVTPVLDAIAARGHRVNAAYSHNGYTAQSRHHLMSGSLADLRGGTSLIDDFEAQGYQVGYFSGQDDSFRGMSVGAERADVMFDARQARNERYSTFSTAGSLAVPASTVLDRVRKFLGARSHETPLFLYVNFHDTHYPYWHNGMPNAFTDAPLSESAISPSRRDALRATYYNATSYVDAAIGQLLAQVNDTTGRRPAVIVIGDHGESLFDDTFLGHGYALNDPQTRIPLLAADIALDIREPFGQSDLRGAIGEALATAAPQAMPSARVDNSKNVFQYLGVLDRPGQIGLIGAASRITYDFRSGRVCVDDQPCAPAAHVGEPQQSRYLELIRRWESMIVARATAGVRNRP